MSDREEEAAGRDSEEVARGGARALGGMVGLGGTVGSLGEEPVDLGLTAIGPVGSDRKARDWALVLQSMSIWHLTRRAPAGWLLFVRDADYPRAATSIDRYELENRDWPPRRARERLQHPISPVAPLLFLALCAFFLVTGPVSAGSRWFQQGTAVADLVVTSQPWRAVTALTLHADSVHVLGNAISGTLFGSAVYRRLGPGGGSLAILASGVFGNFLNALWHHGSGHGSIGASTAVFGAVGILAATQLVMNRPAGAARSSWLDIAGPIVGGLALLGTLGASPRADLGAHLFGFLAGAVIGLFALGPRRLFPKREESPPSSVSFGDEVVAPRWWIQPLLGALSLGVVVGAWQLALRR